MDLSIILTHNNVLNQTDELEELISGCIRNDRMAQEKVYRLFYPKMMGMVRRYFPEQVYAEEILNNGFLKVFTKIHTYTFKGAFEGWLRKIFFREISNYAKEHVRYQKHHVHVTREEFVSRDHAQDLYYEDLQKLIEELPNASRVVFNMFVIDGVSHQEIAKTLNISEGTSKWHVSNARKELKEKIEKLKLHLKK